MPIKIGHRPDVKNGGQYPPRAALIGCDSALCDKGMYIGVNTESTVAQCLRDTIRYLIAKKPNGWTVDATVDPVKVFCGHHSKSPAHTRDQAGNIILGGDTW